MARFSRDSYNQMYDALLSEELCYNSAFASEENIRTAIKRVLGRSIKMGGILMYSDLVVDSKLDVHFTIKDPDGDFVPIDLVYGG
jgi:hypothetical protein